MNYKIIDPLVQATSGALVTFAVQLLVPTFWNMMLAMLAGGVCGMILMMLTMIPLMAVLGSFEVMIPMALVNMTVGMLSGMVVTRTPAPAGSLILAGAVTGLIIYGLVWNSNRKLTRE